jgi:hypothetical protein
MDKRIYIWRFFLALLLFGTSALGYSQDAPAEEDTEPSELHLFRGGFLDLNFGFNMNSLGGSLGSSGMGGLITTQVYNGALNVDLNPAMLAFNHSGHMVVNSRFGLGTAMNSGLNKRILNSLNANFDSSITETFSDEATWTQFPETYIQPTKLRNLDAGLRPDIGMMAFSLPVTEELTLAASYNYPLSMQLDMGLTGISAKLAQEQGTDEVAIRFDVLMNISMLMEMELQMSKLSVGGGYKLVDTPAKRISAGFAISRYQLDNVRRLQADLSGMVVVGGADERYFNNPLDPNLNRELGETNTFAMNAYADYRSIAYGYTLGFVYQTFNGINASLSYKKVPSFDLIAQEGAYANTYLPVFIAATGEELLQGDITVALDSLQANKPNLTTERDIGSLVSNGKLNLPSSLSLGLDFKVGLHTMVFNYTYYDGQLSYEHGSTVIGKQASHGIGFGMDLMLEDRFGSFASYATIPLRLLLFDIDGMLFQALGNVTSFQNSHIRFGGKIMTGIGIDTREDVDGYGDLLGNVLPQSLSLGRQYTIFDNIDVGVTVLAIPDMFLKYSIGISF